MSHLVQPAAYIIVIQGRIDCAPLEWSGPVTIASAVADDDQAITTLSGIVTDQAGLIGLIRHLHGLGIVLLSVTRHTQISNRSLAIDGETTHAA